MRHIAALLLLAVSLSPVAFSAVTPDDGNKLLDSCKDYPRASQLTAEVDRVKVMYCVGYVGGFTDGLIVSKGLMKDKSGPPNVCAPEQGVQHGQAVLVVLKWLNEHPNLLHQDAPLLITLALEEGFPCK